MQEAQTYTTKMQKHRDTQRNVTQQHAVLVSKWGRGSLHRQGGASLVMLLLLQLGAQLVGATLTGVLLTSSHNQLSATVVRQQPTNHRQAHTTGTLSDGPHDSARLQSTL
jgi:hypothetical protein